MALLPSTRRAARRTLNIPPRSAYDQETVITARDLTRRFGDFVAVDRANFSIERGEIFGFVGSNGCGKTTTMKMLTGLLPASTGEAKLFGRPVDATDLQQRYHVGYMSQSFSLYAELTVRQNLALHARLYHLPAEHARYRIADLVERFGLSDYLDQPASSVPLGIRQRLSLAVAVVHEPALLILDEPTSGVDPLARDRFWELLIDLSHNQGVTIFVSTHFMNEAERCDRVALMHAGRVLATGTPAALISVQSAAKLEDAFIRFLEAADHGASEAPSRETMLAVARPAGLSISAPFSLRRLITYAIRESLELWRDPIRLSFSLVGTALLMLVFGFGINTDVNHLAFAAFDRDQTPESIDYLKEFRGSIYFSERAPITDYVNLERRLASGELKLAIEIPSGFGRDVRRGRPVEVGAWVDGAMPFRAETTRGYLLALHGRYLSDLAASRGAEPAAAPADIEMRFRYNQDFESARAMIPGTISILLALIPAILMAVAVVREKELGSITNLYVTPVTRLEFLLGKQLPYIAISMINFAVLVSMAEIVFDVPVQGSVIALIIGTLIYVVGTTAYGMVMSAFARTQIAALFGTAIRTVLPSTQRSGRLMPVSWLAGVAALIGHAFPMTYYLPVSIGAFTKSLGFSELGSTIAQLALFSPVLIGLSLLLLRKQER